MIKRRYQIGLSNSFFNYSKLVPVLCQISNMQFIEEKLPSFVRNTRRKTVKKKKKNV